MTSVGRFLHNGAGRWTHDQRFNQYHGKDGKFSSKNGAGGLTQVSVVDAKPVADPAAYGETHPMDATFEERQAVQNYTGSAYRYINPYLRGTESYSNHKVDEHAEIDPIRSAIAKNTVPEDVMVYRRFRSDAIGDNAFHDADLTGLTGSVIQDKGFMSTSLLKDPPENMPYGDYNVLMQVRVPKGTHALYTGKDMSDDPFSSEEPLSYSPREREMLLGDGTKLAVLGMRKEGRNWVMDTQVVQP